MVSQLNLAGYIFAALLVVVTAGILYVLLRRKNRELETGMVGAIGYGVTGYLWGGLLFPIVVLAIIGNIASLVSLQNGFYPLYLLFVSLFNAVFTTLANVWGIYLTNQKQHSLYRSATIGIGYGFANALIVTGMPLFSAIQINRGVQEATEAVSKIRFMDVMANGISSAAMIIFFALSSMLIGNYLIEKNWKYMIMTGLVCYGGINLIRTSIDNLISDTVSPYVAIAFMLVVAVVSFRIIRERLLKDKMES